MLRTVLNKQDGKVDSQNNIKTEYIKSILLQILRTEYTSVCVRSLLVNFLKYFLSFYILNQFLHKATSLCELDLFKEIHKL